MRIKSSWRIALFLLLIGLLLTELLPITGIALNDSDNKVIVSFDMPVTEIIVPLGTEIEDIPLPGTLTATLEGEGDTATDIPIIWEDSGLYNKEAAGTYLFTADIGTWTYAQARPVAIVTIVPSGIHISGKLWLDENEDGIKDAGETGIAGYPVMLYVAGDLNTAVQVTETKADGTYRFEGMAPGSYVVAVTSETVGETEYLLPWTIVNDNKFAMDEEAAASWSAPLDIAEDTAVSSIDAGMRLPVGIMPLVNPVTVNDFDSLKMIIEYVTLAPEQSILIANDIVFTDSITVEQNVTIKAAEGVGTVTLTSANQRHFIVPADSNVELTFENVILDGGETGGGIEARGSLDLTGATIQNCKAATGGGIYVLSGIVNMTNCKISGNTATYFGGGICDYYGTVTVKGGEVSGNMSNWGGGIFVVDGTVIVEGGAVSGNTASDRGGGIYIGREVDGGIVTVKSGGAVSGNTASDGGGIYASNSTVNVEGGEVSYNTAISSGGGIYITDITKLSVSAAVTFSDNEASISARPLPYLIDYYSDKIATTSTTSIYTHPLNNYDIGMLGMHVVTVRYVDGNGNSVDEPDGYAAVFGVPFTLLTENIQPIPGYVYAGWRQGTDGALQNRETPVTLPPYVTANTLIYLVYTKINVTVSSEVSGDYADKTKDFIFTIQFTDGSEAPLTGTLAYTGGTVSGSGAAAPPNGTLTLGSNGEAIFTLRHGQQITIAEVPADGKVLIQVNSESGYIATWRDGNLLLTPPGLSTGELTMTGTDRTIACTETSCHDNDIVTTGIRTDGTGTAQLLALLAGASIFLLAVDLIRRRCQKGVMN